jgi:hypothetical protein
VTIPEPRLPFLDRYSGQTTDELIALEGTFRTDSIVVAFSRAVAQRAERLGDAQLSTPERVILAVEAVEDRVNNDGFDSLLRYDAALVPDIVPSLIAIGCDAVADLARSAIEAVGIDGPVTSDAIESAMDEEDESRDARLEALDLLYYQLPKDLADPLIAFIKANRNQITLP